MMTIVLMIDDGRGTEGRMCRGDWSEELHDGAFHGATTTIGITFLLEWMSPPILFSTGW
jgi:hypothetical protein